jgi:putative phosphoesterase
MRLAVLADVHGNLPALEAVLEDVANEAPDRIIVNGDSVNRGPEGAAVMTRLAALDADTTLGNHDDLLRRIAERDPALPDDFRRRPFWEANRWCAQRLVEGQHLEALRSLVMTVRIELPGAPSVLVSHGSPRHLREGYSPFMPDEVLSEIVEEHRADVLVGSHTHRPLARRWGRVAVYNTGAVGSPFNGDHRAQYLLLTLEGGAWVPRFRRVAYDVDAALAAYGRSGYLDEGGLLAQLFYDEVRDARSYLVPFQMWSSERGLPLGETTWATYRREAAERFGPAAPRQPLSESVPPSRDAG